jgi:signal transduction histidine kinase
MDISDNPAARLTRLTLLEWLSFLLRLFWLLALIATAGFSGALDLKLAFIFVAWLSYAVLLMLMRPLIHENSPVGWLISGIDLTMALMMITLSGGLSSPMWSSLLLGASVITLMHGSGAGVLLAGIGLLAAGSIQFILNPAGFLTLLAWFLFCGPVLLGAAVIGKLLEQIMGLLHMPSQALRSIPKVIPHSSRTVKSLFHLAAELNASLNYDRVIALTLELSANALAGETPVDDHLVGAVLMFEGDQLMIKAERGLTRADRRLTFPAKKGLLAKAINSGDPCLADNPKIDPELQRLVALHTCHQALAVPLAIGMETYGVLLTAHPFSGYFTPERIDLMEAVGQQVIVALQNARLYHTLEQEKDRIIRIEEEARNKLARDLHDGPTQSIAAIAMRVNFARRLLDRDHEKAVSELEKVEDLARKTTREIRNMLFTLRPLILESQGLVAALFQLAEKLGASNQQRIDIDVPGDITEQLDLQKQGVLFYIAEEAVHNALKHADAEHILVRIRVSNSYVILQVEDDGVGFNTEAVDRDYHQRESLGLVNMRERTELLNGLLAIESREGHGTLITATIPITEEAAEKLHRPGLSPE